jgi:hypothetical protein
MPFSLRLQCQMTSKFFFLYTYLRVGQNETTYWWAPFIKFFSNTTHKFGLSVANVSEISCSTLVKPYCEVCARRIFCTAFTATTQHLLQSSDWTVVLPLSPDEVMTGYKLGLITSRVLRTVLCDWSDWYVTLAISWGQIGFTRPRGSSI